MHMPSLFVLLVYVSGYMFLVFAAVCLACGLYYLVELAEEYTTLTRRLVRAAIYTQLCIHAALWAYERFPFMPCALGVAAHLAYLLLLSTFPFINPLSAPFAAACVMFIADNVAWFRFFHSDIELFYSYRVAPGPAVAAFMLLVVWLVPLAFFVSLSVNDSVLPSAAALPARRPDGLQSRDGEVKKRPRNLVMACIQSVVVNVKHSLNMLLGSSTSRRGHY